MKHAYLIIAHNNWEQLKILIKTLDDKRNDIYIHIDRKANDFPFIEFENITQYSCVELYQEIIVYWGGYSQVECELFLFKKALKGNYEYYHLISGVDLPIKTQDYIHMFFEKHKGKEFIHFDTEERLNSDAEIRRRTRLYHFLQNYRRRYKCNLSNQIFTFCERVLLVIQLILKVNRLEGIDIIIKYGSNWISVTHEFVEYILLNKKFIEKVFKYTNCADELFIQTLIFNSYFKERLFDDSYSNNCMANMRLIDWERGKNGNPYVWCIDDYDIVINSKCLFSRKFDIGVDDEIVERIINNIKKR